MICVQHAVLCGTCRKLHRMHERLTTAVLIVGISQQVMMLRGIISGGRSNSLRLGLQQTVGMISAPHASIRVVRDSYVPPRVVLEVRDVCRYQITRAAVIRIPRVYWVGVPVPPFDKRSRGNVEVLAGC